MSARGHGIVATIMSSLAMPAFPRFRGVRFSLRSVFAAIAVLSAAAYWFSKPEIDRYHAVRCLAEVGDVFDFQPPTTRRTPRAMLRRWLCGSLAGDVGGISLARKAVTDRHARALCQITEVQWLYLSCTSITDAGLEGFSALTSLGVLFIDSTPITSAGVSHLTSSRSICKLVLHGTQITDDALGGISGMPSLDYLDVGQTQVDDAGILKLCPMSSLTTLRLDETLVTDASMPHLALMPRLQTLTFEFTRVSDAGLRALAGSRSLILVHPTASKATKEGADALMRANPRITVSW